MKSQTACNSIILCLFSLMLETAGCTAAKAPSPPASEPLATGQGANPADLVPGRAYFLRECRSCHRIFMPEERSPAEWRAILGRKSAKVSLTAAQFEKLTAYVLAASAAKNSRN